MTGVEAIIEARRKKAAGEFDRMVTKTTPEDVRWDRIELECGHKSASSTFLRSRDAAEKVFCHRCADQWIEANSEDARKKAKWWRKWWLKR